MITSEDVLKAPFHTMKILGHKLLRGKLGSSYPDQVAKTKIITLLHKQRMPTAITMETSSSQRSSKLTSGGRHSSAWRRSTDEKLTCLLVSEAVNVLQNECTRSLAGAAGGAEGISSLEPLSSGRYTQNKQMICLFKRLSPGNPDGAV